MGRGFLLLLGEPVEIGLDVPAGLFLGRPVQGLHLEMAENPVVDDGELVQFVSLQGRKVFLEVLEDFPAGEDLPGGDAAEDAEAAHRLGL